MDQICTELIAELRHLLMEASWHHFWDLSYFWFAYYYLFQINIKSFFLKKEKKENSLLFYIATAPSNRHCSFITILLYTVLTEIYRHIKTSKDILKWRQLSKWMKTGNAYGIIPTAENCCLKWILIKHTNCNAFELASFHSITQQRYLTALSTCAHAGCCCVFSVFAAAV